MTNLSCAIKHAGLLLAAVKGDAAEVARFIPLTDPTLLENSALCVAADAGHVECVKLLIPVSTAPITDELYSPLIRAVRRGHTECASLLIPVTEKPWIHFALCVAVERNDIGCVKLFMPACDPKEHNSRPLQLAALNGHARCVELLYPVSDPIVALKQLQYDHPDHSINWGQLQEMIEVERVRNTLNAEVGTTTAVKVQRKM